MMLATVRAIVLDYHSVIRVHTESVLDGVNIRAKAVSRNLRTCAKARGNISQESISGLVSAFADLEGRDNLSFGVNSAERPHIAKGRIVIERDVLFLFAD